MGKHEVDESPPSPGWVLVAEDYVQCTEAQGSGETPDEALPADAIGLDVVGGTQLVDCRHHFDEHPIWGGVTPQVGHTVA